MKKKHIQLQPVGGIAGDMFVAAILDAFPKLKKSVASIPKTIGIEDEVELTITDHNDSTLTGTLFDVVEKHQRSGHEHRHYSQIKKLINNSKLTKNVKKHAIGIFDLLAEAESKVHGISIDEIAFHEVGALDSIVDIVSTAFLIDALGAVSWSCDPLPMGSGKIESAHGLLPLPAPAVVLLLEGFPVYQDQYEGERVTPTGAAILRYLDPEFIMASRAEMLKTCGTGFGTRKFEGMSNILRVLITDAEDDNNSNTGTVAVIEFEIDDQTPEDLSVAIEQLRKNKFIHDVIHSPVYAKKGRIAQQVQILCVVDKINIVAEEIFTQTTTIGLRWHVANRITLERSMFSVTSKEANIQVKLVERPARNITAKAEIDDSKGQENSHAERDQLRNSAESDAIDSFHKKND